MNCFTQHGMHMQLNFNRIWIMPLMTMQVVVGVKQMSDDKAATHVIAPVTTHPLWTADLLRPTEADRTYVSRGVYPYANSTRSYHAEECGHNLTVNEWAISPGVLDGTNTVPHGAGWALAIGNRGAYHAGSNADIWEHHTSDSTASGHHADFDARQKHSSLQCLPTAAEAQQARQELRHEPQGLYLFTQACTPMHPI